MDESLEALILGKGYDTSAAESVEFNELLRELQAIHAAVKKGVLLFDGEATLIHRGSEPNNVPRLRCMYVIGSEGGLYFVNGSANVLDVPSGKQLKISLSNNSEYVNGRHKGVGRKLELKGRDLDSELHFGDETSFRYFPAVKFGEQGDVLFWQFIADKCSIGPVKAVRGEGFKIHPTPWFEAENSGLVFQLDTHRGYYSVCVSFPDCRRLEEFMSEFVNPFNNVKIDCRGDLKVGSRTIGGENMPSVYAHITGNGSDVLGFVRYVQCIIGMANQKTL